MNKTQFVNNSEPALSAEVLNQMQNDIEQAINEGDTSLNQAIQSLSNSKANVSDVYNKQEIYTKTETDDLLEEKVDKEEGKSLMSDAEHTKLEGIEENAQVNVIEYVSMDGQQLSFDGKTVELKEAVVNALEPSLTEVEQIAKGRSTGYVFDTYADMEEWLQNADNVAKLVLGDNLYITATDVPDYWWDGTQAQQLETQKVDLTEYATHTEVINATKDKVNKEFKTGSTAEYKVLSDNNYTNQDKQNNTNNITEITNARTSAIKNKTFDSVDARLEELEEDVDKISTTRGHVYGVRRKISSNSSSNWERTDDAVGLVANATKNGGTVQNDFDNLSPWKDIISFNLDLETGKKKAYYGDPDFKFDGSNGDVYTHIPDIYYKIWQENDYDYIQIADYAKFGFTKCNAFDIQRYHTGLVDNVLRSYSGLAPAYNKTLPSFRTSAKALGDDYCLLDWRQFILQILYLVEYADYNTQSKLGNGMTSMRLNNGDVALVAESSTNRFIVNTTAGNVFYVGQTISIGTSGYGNFGVAANRKITAIADYDEDGVVGKEITFDGDAVNIALTNVIWSSGQHSGGCDSLGMKSGCLVNDSKHAVIYRGVENWFGNIWQWVDGLNIKDYQAYVCYEPSEYASDKFTDPYKALGYVNASSDGYVKTLGLDVNDPLVRFPVEVGGGSSTYMSDYYYRNTENRVALVGGHLYNGADAGAWFWSLYVASSFSNWYIGARVLKYQ